MSSFFVLVATLTLGGPPLASGEILHVIVPGPVHRHASVGAPVARTLGLGAEVEAVTLHEADEVSWVELRTGGFIQAARVDRIPQAVDGDLVPGAEGLVGGRVLPWSYEPSDLADVPAELKAIGYRWRRMRLRKSALAAFQRLADAAARENLAISILSAYRDGEYQRGLYSRAIERNPSQVQSAPPGRSEHQLGTTVDIAVPGVANLTAGLETSPCYGWLLAHATEFGFVISYSRDRHASRGVAFEPWHLRWVGEATGDDSRW